MINNLNGNILLIFPIIKKNNKKIQKGNRKENEV